MTDLTRDLHLLVTVARIEAAQSQCRMALQRLPQEIAVADQAIAGIDAAEKKAHDEIEEMKKKRRDVERSLREHEDHLRKSRGQMPLIKKNDEYTAMMKELSALEATISQEEEHLLILMDSMEGAEKTHAAHAGTLQTGRDAKLAEKARLEGEVKRVTAEAQRLATEKAKLLAEISPALVKRYERLMERHRDVAVTRAEGDHCGGCRQQIPPQLAVEVRKNDQLITCPACGRILVHYEN